MANISMILNLILSLETLRIKKTYKGRNQVFFLQKLKTMEGDLLVEKLEAPKFKLNGMITPQLCIHYQGLGRVFNHSIFTWMSKTVLITI